MVHERYRETDRQATDRQTTDGLTTTYSERQREFKFAKSGTVTTRLIHIFINLYAKFEVSSLSRFRDRVGPKIQKVDQVTITRPLMNQFCILFVSTNYFLLILVKYNLSEFCQ